jgi:hypothetical protein
MAEDAAVSGSLYKELLAGEHNDKSPQEFADLLKKASTELDDWTKLKEPAKNYVLANMDRIVGLYASEGREECVFPTDPHAPEWATVLHEFGTWTLAHEAAASGCLPAGFDRWELAHEKNVTVAHIAATGRHLPEGFSKWDLGDKWGSTVAHYAAWLYPLPAGFTQWELADCEGVTVAHVAGESGTFPVDVPDAALRLADRRGRTVADVIVEENAKHPERHPQALVPRAKAVNGMDADSPKEWGA